MNLADLKPGHLYRLTQDVQNPCVDKRSANPLRKHPIFKVGTHFVCLCDEEFPNQTLLAYGDYRVFRGEGTFTASLNHAGVFGPSTLKFDSQWGPVIVPHLEPVEIDDWKKLQRTFGFRDTGPVLRSLWEDGTLTWDRILELLREHTPGASRE
jgi:hypothetical protein